MDKALMLLAADLLDLAAQSYGNHGCNDYKLPKDMPMASIEALALLANRANYGDARLPSVDPDELETARGMRRCSADFIVMGALAFGLREEANKATA